MEDIERGHGQVAMMGNIGCPCGQRFKMRADKYYELMGKVVYQCPACRVKSKGWAIVQDAFDAQHYDFTDDGQDKQGLDNPFESMDEERARSVHLVHDWRTHVPDCIINAWSTLPLGVRICVALTAQHAADDELWD